ncbi:MarR family winged helix-turn-helix transcriptional regulator [Streptomyces sp. NPDC059785]|uniref:MarR family winged helix-turn-helix transcriptional regulator n=1 Tax=Streptomyces sp. NPDC059785 TaxID=3346945 RepID=UPI00364674C7
MTTTTAPAVNGQLIGTAHYASRALLEAVLARTGTTFEESVALRAVSDQGGSVERTRLTDRLTGALKIDGPAAEETVGTLAAAGLLEVSADGRASLTAVGRELFAGINESAAGIAARLYAGIPAEDLAVTGRVLTLVRERADAELASA